MFCSPLKTTFEHMLCAKPTKLIASPTSVSSSSEIPQLSQLKFQKSFSILLPFLYAVTSPCTLPFLSSLTPTAHPSFSAPPPTPRHLWICTCFFYFLREVFDIMHEDLSYGSYSLPFELSGKFLQVILTLLFFSFILYIPNSLFLSGANKKSF